MVRRLHAIFGRAGTKGNEYCLRVGLKTATAATWRRLHRQHPARHGPLRPPVPERSELSLELRLRWTSRCLRAPSRSGGTAMDLGLKGKVALVTGGARDIGREIAVRLGAEGASVAVNYHRSKADAEATVAEIRQRGGQASAYQADVADYEAVSAMIAASVRDLGRLDVLVNNAGFLESRRSWKRSGNGAVRSTSGSTACSTAATRRATHGRAARRANRQHRGDRRGSAAATGHHRRLARGRHHARQDARQGLGPRTSPSTRSRSATSRRRTPISRGSPPTATGSWPSIPSGVSGARPMWHRSSRTSPPSTPPGHGPDHQQQGGYTTTG